MSATLFFLDLLIATIKYYAKGYGKTLRQVFIGGRKAINQPAELNMLRCVK